MKLLLFFVVLLEVSHRRVHSDPNVQDVLPFLVGIEAKGKKLDCVGTILNSRFVLTSAHCVDSFRASDVKVIHFGNSLKAYETSSIIIYPGYGESPLRNDIALLHLYHEFQKPYASVSLTNVTAQPKCSTFQVVGWPDKTEDSSSKDEREETVKPVIAPVQLMPNSECKALIRNNEGMFKGVEKLCGISNEDQECFTERGGPLLCTLSSSYLEMTTPPMVEAATTMTAVVNSDQSNERKIVNETLDDPIDLLADLDKSKEVVAKRGAEAATKAPVVSFVQVGVVSWGKSCSKIPSIYTRTDLFYPWITTQLTTYNPFSKRPHFTFLTPLKGAGFRTSSSSRFLLLTATAILFVWHGL